MKELVSTTWLAAHLQDDSLVVVDTRWVNGDPDGGRLAYLSGHLPGAVFLDLDTDLSDRSDLTKGRHPLPDPVRFARRLAEVGIGRGTAVVAYDDVFGSVAARLWWMLEWIGAGPAAVLDGGIQKWQAEGRPLETGGTNVTAHSKPIVLTLHPELMATIGEVERVCANGPAKLIDARARERYRGETEPIDTRAGHIPGAISLPFAENMTSDGVPVFKSSEELAKRFRAVGLTRDSEIISYCGSGVTACHDLLALRLAGFTKLRLYPGSWSAWIEHHDA